MCFLLYFGLEAERDLWLINTQPQPRPHAATAPPRPKQSTTPTHYKITPNNHGPMPEPITNHPNNQWHQPRHDRRLGPIGPPDRVESERDEPRAKKKASAISHGIESPKAKNTAANISILVSTEALRSSRATAPREIGSGRQRDRLRFQRRGLGFEGEERELESEREEKRKNDGRGERKII